MFEIEITDHTELCISCSHFLTNFLRKFMLLVSMDDGEQLWINTKFACKHLPQSSNIKCP